MNKIGYITYPELGYTDLTSESNLNSKVVGTITDGTEVTITNSENNFYEIVGNKISGWVPQNRVSSMYQKAYIAFPSVGYTDVTSESTWYSKVVGTITDGTEVIIVNSAEGFYQIINGDSMVWAPENRVFPMYQKAYIAFPSVGYTDVTSESTWYSNVVGTITDGTEVIIVDSAEGFYQIINGDSMVWAPENRVFPMYQIGYISYPQIGYTDIMSESTWDSNCIGTINDGAKVIIINNAYCFYEIINGTSTGWVAGNRVTTTPPQVNPPQENIFEPLNKVGYVLFSDFSYTDIMNSYTWDTSVAGTLENGTTVSIKGKQNGWYQIEFNGSVAWIICNRVYIPEPFIQVTGVITEEGKIQRIPSMNSIQNVGICNKGSKVTIISKVNGWYQILNSNNNTSWIPTANIQLLIFSKE